MSSGKTVVKELIDHFNRSARYSGDVSEHELMTSKDDSETGSSEVCPSLLIMPCEDDDGVVSANIKSFKNNKEFYLLKTHQKP